MNTSSSAAARQRSPDAASETAPFPYAEAALQGVAVEASNAEEQNRLRESKAFEQGHQQGLEQAQSELRTALQEERSKIAVTLSDFTNERQDYYRRVESEVVQLALAVARKILHREAQLDPQALAGIVRVTLEKLDAGTQVNLHVPPKEAADLRHYFACQLEGTPTPEIHEDATLAAGECRIETSLGTTQVGFASQLKEIETGLLDLLAERPSSK